MVLFRWIFGSRSLNAFEKELLLAAQGLVVIHKTGFRFDELANAWVVATQATTVPESHQFLTAMTQLEELGFLRCYSENYCWYYCLTIKGYHWPES